MIRLILRKLVLMAIILVLLNYVAYHFAIRHPGNFYFPFSNIPNPDAAPIESQYPAYVQGVLRGDLGSVAGVTVMEIIREPVRNSLILLVTALAVTAAAGLFFGFIAISPRTWRIRPGALLFLTAGSSMPGFVFGAIVLALLMYQLLYAGAGATLLPISGFGLDAHLILPVLVLSIQPTFHLAKVTAGLLESELQKDYIQVANSKGLTWSHIIRRHAWPNMLSPLLVTIGHALRLMVGALVIVEAVFLWPGVGRLALLAIGLRLDAGPSGAFFGDPNLIAILAVIMGSWLLIADLITAVLAYRLDHRVRVALETSGVTPA
ncbi:ABC transporter permease subunit [Promineifilum sp.]|uniref:ABC transporter permease subunit n=1 Tax=Promineifilum sp. TaxID=2664178 RepID=UPI0035AEFCCB